MSAYPIITGKLYRVHAMGKTFEVVADSACSAIIVALDLLLGAP